MSRRESTATVNSLNNKKDKDKDKDSNTNKKANKKK